MIIAVARKLAIALWRFLEQGLVPQGAMLANTGNDTGGVSRLQFRRSFGCVGRVGGVAVMGIRRSGPASLPC
jgi:hypothetical protein